MTQFKHGLCGCFDNCGICVVTYFCPCYTAGKVAQAVGKNCCLHGCLLFVPIANVICRCLVRGEVRKQNAIGGSAVGDCCAVLFCSICTLCQEAQETNVMGNSAMALEQDIERE